MPRIDRVRKARSLDALLQTWQEALQNATGTMNVRSNQTLRIQCCSVTVDNPPLATSRSSPAHIDRPVPVLRIRDELRYGLDFRKGRSAKNDKTLKINTLFKPSFRGPRAVD
jgi:hypothetical protein